MSTENQMNVGGGYEQAANKPENTEMGGGVGAQGSGVAGGWDGQSGNQQQSGQQQSGQQQSGQQQSGEKQDWLDKGIQMAGKKAGVNVSAQNADRAGDFANKEFDQYEGRNIPGVQ